MSLFVNVETRAQFSFPENAAILPMYKQNDDEKGLLTLELCPALPPIIYANHDQRAPGMVFYILNYKTHNRQIFLAYIPYCPET